jgi:hypothetical protein
VTQAAVQHLPLWLTPQIPEVQASSSSQAVPAARVAMQLPLEHQKPAAQSAVLVQLASQAVAFAQIRLPEQGTGVPASHIPEPAQAPGVSMLPMQLGVPQVVVLTG